MNVPAFLPYYVLGFTLAIVAVLVFGLNAALTRAGWARDERRRAVRIAAFGG